MTDSPQPRSSRARSIDVGAQQVAATYAKALLGATEKTGTTEAVLAEVDTLIDDVLDKHPQFEAILASALIPHKEKCEMLDRVFGSRFSHTMLDFLKVVSSHGRLDILRAIHQQLHKRYNELRGRVRVRLRTATPVNGEVTSDLEKLLRQLFQGEPHVEAEVDPSLIGGLVLRIGDTVYDGSVARQLHQLREQIIHRSVHEIQSRRDRFRHSGGD